MIGLFFGRDPVSAGFLGFHSFSPQLDPTTSPSPAAWRYGSEASRLTASCFSFEAEARSALSRQIKSQVDYAACV